MLAVRKFKKNITLLIPLFLFALTFGVYVHHLSPSVYGGDVGDFVTAVAVKGVPHPSGYPLFVLLGILFNLIPLHQTVAWKVGLVSAFFSSFSVVLMYLISNELAKNRIIAIASALTLAFIYPFWLYAEVGEVFGLTYFFVLLIIYISLLYYLHRKKKYLYILSFIAGLSLSNHEIIILIFPSVLLLVIATNYKIFLSPLTLLRCFFLFILGLLPYMYIPIAASHHPLINWGNAVNLKNFLNIVLRINYGWLSHGQLDKYYRDISLFVYPYISYWLIELSLFLIITCIFGMIKYIRDRKLVLFLVFILALFLSGPFYVIYGPLPILGNFQLGVIERFYMISGIFFILFLPIGMLFISGSSLKILARLSNNFKKKKYYKYLFLTPFLTIPLFLFINNFQKTDLHNVWIGDYIAEDILTSLPKNSAIGLKGDSIVFNTIYIHEVKGLRKDILIATPTTFLNDRNYLKIYEGITSKYRNIPSDAAFLLTMQSYVQNKAFFLNAPVQSEDKKYPKTVWIPYGLVNKLANESDKNQSERDYLAIQEKIWNKFHLPEIKNNPSSLRRSLTLSEIRQVYAYSAVSVGNYIYLHYNNTEKAREYYQKAIDIDSQDTLGYEAIGLTYKETNSCERAVQYFTKSIDINRWDKRGYRLLYDTYKTCFKDEKRADMVSKTYLNIFHLPISEESKK